MSVDIRDNVEKSRFELVEEGHTAWADYRRQDGKLVIPHVEAPMALRGTGAAGRLMQGVMEKARADGMKVVPLCGYASAWIRRHKEFHDLLG